MKKLAMIISILMCFWSSLAIAFVPDTIVIQDNNSIDTSIVNIQPIPEVIIPEVKVKIKPIDCKAPFRKLSTEQLLALTIYGESRSESIEGKIAVGTVILQRHIQLNQSIKRVILKHNQFSCFSLKDKQYERLTRIALNWKANYKKLPALQECYELSKGLLNGKIVGHKLLMENTATHFKTVKVTPKWSKKFRLICQIGGHQFYTETAARIDYASYNTIFIKRNILLSMKDSIENHSA